MKTILSLPRFILLTFFFLLGPLPLVVSLVDVLISKSANYFILAFFLMFTILFALVNWGGTLKPSEKLLKHVDDNISDTAVWTPTAEQEAEAKREIARKSAEDIQALLQAATKSLEVNDDPRRSNDLNYEALSKLAQEATPQTRRYIELRRKYRDYSVQQSKSFLEEYRHSIKNLDNLVSQCDTLVDKYISDGIDFSLNDVIILGIYDISKEEFRKKYFTPYDTWKHDFKPVRDKYDEITLSVAELARKREEERNRSSGGIIGGGFGLEGAAKGIAIATAANLAISALGGIVNAATASLEAGKTKRDKEAIFNDSALAPQIAASAKALLFSIHFAVVDLANERENQLAAYHVPSSEDIKKSRAIFENITSGRVDGEMVAELMQQVFALNPYDEKIYEYCLRQYGDASNALLGISTFFSVDEVPRFKAILIDEYLKTLNLTSIEFCIQAIYQLRNYGRSLGIADVSSSINKIQLQVYSINSSIVNAKIKADMIARKAEEAAERESRTFDGFAYATVAEKALAVEKSNKWVKGVYYEDVEEANRVRFVQAEKERAKIDVGWTIFLLILLIPFPCVFLLMFGDYRWRTRLKAFSWMIFWFIYIIFEPKYEKDRLAVIVTAAIIGSLISAFLIHKERKSRANIRAGD